MSNPLWCWNRRQFLRSLLAAGAVLGALPAHAAGLPRVKVSRQRLIRTEVGLRPYRPEGFVLKAEPLGDKLLVHNYGHGGAGITLSLGCAQLAADLLQGVDPGRVAVLGAGVMGLTAARELQRRGWPVTIYARDLPPHTTSNVAGGYWKPVSVYDYKRITQEFRRRFNTACQVAHRRFQELVGTDHAVRWIQSFDMREKFEEVRSRMPGGDELYPEHRLVADPAEHFAFPHVRRFQTMLIEPHVFLHALLRDFQLAGGSLKIREFHSPAELDELPESLVFNCTGLGAAALFADAGLVPARGQLEVLLPQPEIDYCYTSPAGYMFPRRDGIVLGGSFEVGNGSREPDPVLTTRILEGNARVARGLR